MLHMCSNYLSYFRGCCLWTTGILCREMCLNKSGEADWSWVRVGFFGEIWMNCWLNPGRAEHRVDRDYLTDTLCRVPVCPPSQKAEWSHTWKQIVSTFIKHSLQEINITKLFPPKLAYFFNQCIIVNQLAVFKQHYFLLLFWRPLNIKYVQKVRIDVSKTKWTLISLWLISSSVSASPDV